MLLTSPISFPNLGITVDPSPVAFTIFGKEIYWYGIIIACGFLLAVLYMMYRANTFGLTQDDVLDLILWAVPIGVVCARLYYCVFYWDLYRDNPISMLYIWEGGLAIYGGIIGGAITVLVLSRVKKIPPLVMLDNASMGVIIGQICGRWGNFMNREAHGSVTDSFFKMGLADAAGNITYYHPTFLYESVWNEPYSYVENNTIVVHISNLRKKIEADPKTPEYIKSMWGKGYYVEQRIQAL